MGRLRNTKKNRFRYDVDRRKLWRKAKKLPKVKCEQMKKQWDPYKGVFNNFAEMGLSADVNKTLRIPSVRETLNPSSEPYQEIPVKAKPAKAHVADDLAKEASLLPEKSRGLSEPLRMFCKYMVNKYGDDYKSMAKDPRNYYQKTPKQIRGTLRLYSEVPYADESNAERRERKQTEKVEAMEAEPSQPEGKKKRKKRGGRKK